MSRRPHERPQLDLVTCKVLTQAVLCWLYCLCRLAELSLTLIFFYDCPPTLASVSPRSHLNIHYVYAIFGSPLLPLTLIHFESWWTPPLHTCYFTISFGDPERSTKAQPNWTWTVGELQGSVFPPLIFLFQFVRVIQRFSLKPLVLPVHFGQLPCLKVKLSDSGSWCCPLLPDPFVILHISQFLFMTSLLLPDTEKHQLSLRNVTLANQIKDFNVFWKSAIRYLQFG